MQRFVKKYRLLFRTCGRLLSLSGSLLSHLFTIRLEEKDDRDRAYDQDQEHHRGDKIDLGTSGSGHTTSLRFRVASSKLGPQIHELRTENLRLET
jgi:hypothetical protein